MISFTGLSQTITGVTSTKENGSYKQGEVIPINVNFDVDVDVTGIPTLTLETGTNDVIVDYVSGSGTSSLLFNYTVEADHESIDLSYVNINSLFFPPKTLEKKSSTSLDGNVYGVNVKGDFAYVSAWAAGLHIVDISDPTDPTKVKTVNVSDANPNRNGTAAVDFIGDFAYVTNAYSIEILDISNPRNPIRVKTVDDFLYSRNMTIVGNVAYVANGRSGLATYDVSDPRNPVLKGVVKLQGGHMALDVTIKGNFAYVSAHTAGLQVIDVSDITNPTLKGRFKGTGSTFSAVFVGDYLYISDSFSGGGLSILDVSDPDDPTRVKSILDIDIMDTKIVGNYAYVAVWSGGVKVYDVTAPLNPVLIDEIDTDGSAFKLHVDNRYIYVSDTRGSFKILDSGGGAISTEGTTENNVSLILPFPGETNSLSANKAIVIDNTIPTVTNVTSNISNGSYKLGQQIPVRVTFSETVTVSGKPTLNLETGTNDSVVDYSFGSGTDTLIFNYTVASDHNTNDLNYVNSNSLSGNITDLALNDADLTLSVTTVAGSLGFNKELFIDGGIPTVTNVNSTKPDGLYKEGDLIPVTVSFSEEVFVIGKPTLTLETGTTDAKVEYSSGTGTSTLKFNYTVASGHSSNDIDYLATNSLVCPAPELGASVSKVTTGESEGITIVGNYAYIADGSSGLAIVDISDPASPGNPVYKDTNGTATSVCVVGNFAYVAAFNGGLAIIDITDPTNPGTPIYRETIGNAVDVTVVGNYAYIADNNSGLAIINISNPARPGDPINMDTDGPATSVFVKGTYAYLADNNAGLAIINISNPSSPGAPVYMNTSGSAYGVTVVENYAYVASRDSGLAIIDVSNPASPGTPVYMNTSGSARSVTVSGNYAYVSDSLDGLAIIDVTNPSNPGSPVYSDTDFAKDVSIDGTHAYVADFALGLIIIPLNTGSIKDAALNDANLTLSSLGTVGSLAVNKDLALDTSIPTVTNVTSSKANGFYKQGDLIPVTVTFSEEVNVTGSPTLSLETGGTDAVVNYSTGTGSETLTFNYTVLAGHVSSRLDYVDTNSLKINNSYNISVSAINNADYRLIGKDKNGLVFASDPNLSFNVGDQITFSVGASGHPYYLKTAPVSGTDNLISGLNNNGTTSGSIVWTPNAVGTYYYQCSLHSAMGGIITISDNGASIKDVALNNATLTLADPGAANSLLANKALVIDTTVPTVTAVTSTKTNGSYKLGDIISVNVAFSEDVNVTGIPTLTLETGTSDAVVNYTSKSASNILKFDYTIEAGHSSNDLDYVASNSLELSSGTIKDTSLNVANLTLASPAATGSLGANKDLVINNAPVAVDDSITINEDSSLTPYNVIANDTDVEGSALTLTVASTSGTGTVAVNADNKSVDYTPASNFNGTEVITYTVSDGKLSDLTGKLTITVNPVNDVPVAVDDKFTVLEDSGLTGIDIITNDINLDGDALTFTAVTSGTGTISSNADNKLVDYKPASNFNGSEVITYTVSDGTLKDTGTLTITVTSVNDAPVANPQTLNVNNDVNLPLTLSGSDIDNDVLTFLIYSLPTNGVLLENGNTILASELPKVIASLNLTYSTNLNYFGPDSFDFKVRDTDQAFDTAQIDITVLNANDAPVGIRDLLTINEDSILFTKNVIENDTDENGDVLSLKSIINPRNGTASINNDNKSIDYTPDANYNGEEIIIYEVSDGFKNNVSALIVTVVPVNDAPLAMDDIATVLEDSNLNKIDVIANDLDVDSSLSITAVNSSGNSLVSLNTVNKSINFTPAANFNGTETITYTLSDGTLNDTGTLTITVNPLNDVPLVKDQSLILNIEDISLDINLTGTDIDGDNLNYFIVTNPSNGKITLSDDKAIYTPSVNFQGSDSFVYKANDGNVDSANATITISVTSYDMDNDGVLNINDKCPNTPPNTTVDINGCEVFTLPANNYNIVVSSVSCKDKNDGSIKINVKDDSLIYYIESRRAEDSTNSKMKTIWVNSNENTIRDLTQGTYLICIYIFSEPQYKQCFKINIEEPKQLSAFLDVDNDKKTTTIQLGGSNLYNVEVNGNRFEVKGNKFTTNLATGLNVIKISTDLDCQGLIEKEVFISEDIHYYPNPTANDVSIHISGEDSNVLVSVFTEKGDLIYSKEQQIQDFSRKTSIDLSSQITGIYIVVMESKTVRKTFKILKK